LPNRQPDLLYSCSCCLARQDFQRPERKLRIRGVSFGAIGKQLGLSKNAAFKLYKKALKQVPEAELKELRKQSITTALRACDDGWAYEALLHELLEAEGGGRPYHWRGDAMLGCASHLRIRGCPKVPARSRRDLKRRRTGNRAHARRA
jgi:hypothetical protein